MHLRLGIGKQEKVHYNLLMEKRELFETRFAILEEISSAIVVADSIGALTNLMLDLAISYSNAEKGSLMLLNERGELYILSARGIDGHLMRTYRVKVGEGIAGTVAGERRAVLVQDIEKDDKFRSMTRDRYRTKSFISCPIVNKNRLHGVLNINDKKDNRPFSEDEFALMKIIADQAAIAIENALLMSQLKAKAAELEEINKKLMETDFIKTESLTHVSHELRTPLNSIKGAIHYLRQGENASHGEQKEFYDIIRNETDRLVAIVENLLDFLRLDDETRIIRKSVVNLPEALRELENSRMLKELLSRKGLRLELQIGETISDIVADRARLGQFFLNLIEGLSGHLEGENRVRVSVEDNGFVQINVTVPKGPPENMLPFLLNSGHPFRSDRPEEGLKLYLARKVAEFHRWELKAESGSDGFVVGVSVPKSSREKAETVISMVMEAFVEFVSDLFSLDVCSIMLHDDLTGELTIRSARGLSEEVIKRTRIRFGDRIAGWVASEGRALLIEDIEKDQRFGKSSIPGYQSRSLLSVPLKTGERTLGVLNLTRKKSGELFTKRDLYIASVVGERISNFISRLHSGEFREPDYRQFIASFGSLLDAEKRYHKKKVLFPDLVMAVMDRLGADEEKKKLALYLSMVYDLGLATIDERVLKKKKLLSSEARALKVHPYTTVSLLGDFEFSEEAREAILHHHERYDGGGYPEGLKGPDIPLISRVISVVDAFYAMTSRRPYGRRYSKADAVEELRREAGTAYDPEIVRALEEAL